MNLAARKLAARKKRRRLTLADFEAREAARRVAARATARAAVEPRRTGPTLGELLAGPLTGDELLAARALDTMLARKPQ